MPALHKYANETEPQPGNPRRKGETNEEYTDRLLRKCKDGVGRQCALGWHEECEDPSGTSCTCDCHGRQS